MSIVEFGREEREVSDAKFFAELCDPDSYREFAPFALKNIWQMVKHANDD